MKPVSRVLITFLVVLSAGLTPISVKTVFSSTSGPSGKAGGQPFFDINSPSTMVRAYPAVVGVLYLGTMLTSFGPITLNGSAGDVLDTDSSGTADDSDGNGRDDAGLQLTYFNLSGSSVLGKIHLNLRPNTISPFMDSLGMLEEQANNTPGVLDMKPFTTSGSADSFFDIYLDVEIAGQVFHNETPLKSSGVFNMTPHQTGDRYTSQTTPFLFDSDNNPTGYRIESFTFFPVAIARVFPRAMGSLTLGTPAGPSELIFLQGVAADRLDIHANGAAVDNDGNGLDDINTMFIQLDMTGSSGLGAIRLLLREYAKSPYQPSAGGMEEQANNTPGILDTPPFTGTGQVDSFFDIYLEIQIAGQPVHNETPLWIDGTFGSAFPFPGDSYINLNHPLLYDESNAPTGWSIGDFNYYPVPYTNMLPVIRKN